MAQGRGGIIALIIGIVCILAGLLLGISSVFPLMSQFNPIEVVQSPAEVDIKIEEAGVYTLWHDHETMVDAKRISNPETLPAGFDFVLISKTDGSQVVFDKIRSTSTVSLGTRESVALGTFAPPAPGTYTLEIENPDRDERVFSLTQGSLLSGMAKFGLRLVIGLILGGGGLVLLILGIVFMVRGPRPRPRPSGPPSSTATPPPPPLQG